LPKLIPAHSLYY